MSETTTIKQDISAVDLEEVRKQLPATITEFQGAFEAPRFNARLKQRLDNRHQLIEWVQGNLVEHVDFGRIHVVKKSQCPDYSTTRHCTNPYHWSKPSLWKPGAEKICGMLGWVPAFPNLSDYTRMVRAGRPIEQIVIQCVIYSGGSIIGEGIGARSVTSDGGDLNKALKMAKKSAHIDATLVSAGLSEIFTQDYGDEVDDDEKPADPYSPGAPRGPARVDVATHCPFGKHKGTPWGEVPADYLDWMVGAITDKPEIVEAVKREIARRQEQHEQSTGAGVQTEPERPHAAGSPDLASSARAIANAKTLEECDAAYEGCGKFKNALKGAHASRRRELEQRASDDNPM